MMPIRMRGNCRLHCEHDKLPPPRRGPSSEARRREVTPSLRVLSAADLDCSLAQAWHGVGGTGPRDPGERAFCDVQNSGWCHCTGRNNAARQKKIIN